MPANLDFEIITSDILQLIKNDLSPKKKGWEKEIQNFLSQNKADIERWSRQLAAQEMSSEEFSNLILGNKDLLLLKTWQFKDQSLQSLNNIKNKIIQIIIKVLIAAIL